MNSAKKYFLPSLLTALLTSLLTGAGLAHADSASGAKTPAIPNLAVKQRLQSIEQINVTSQQTAEPITDPELLTILETAAQLEQSMDIHELPKTARPATSEKQR